MTIQPSPLMTPPLGKSLNQSCVLCFTGIGVAMTRDPATLMVGQYFKRKRELIEIILVSGSGLGIATMSVFVKVVVR